MSSGPMLFRSAAPAVLIGSALTLLSAGLLQAQGAPGKTPPVSWVDKDTGHRIYRLTDEPGSSGFYFNVNAYSADGKLMVYNAPDGIHVLELATKKTRLLVANPPRPATPPTTQEERMAAFRNSARTIVVGHKTNSVFYSKYDADTKQAHIYKADLYTGAVTKLAALPGRGGIGTINADETLGAGVYNETDEGAAQEFGRNSQRAQTPARPGQPPQAGNLVQAPDKSQMMERRLAARIPVVLFTMNLETGKITELLHSTDWIGHLLFSPADPTLLMYCHEGPWHKVDRVWTIHTDGTNNKLMHKRTMLMEIAGHEFWGLDGQTIWYDWQTPKGEDFWLAGYNMKTGERTAYHMGRNDWSIHFNLTQDLDMFIGDGGDTGQVAHAPDGTWIELFHPSMRRNEDGLNEPDFVHPGMFQSEHLVNMAHHNYRLEPNVRFSPDKKMVFFTSNMFGSSYLFGVEVAKAQNPSAADMKSTPELGKPFAPDPTPTPDDK